MSYTPSGDSRVVLWLKADLGPCTDTGGATPCTTNGQHLGSWVDQSANGYLFVQATGADQPEYLTNAQGSLPGVDFLGNWLTNSAGIVAQTIFAVVAFDAGATAGTRYSIIGCDWSGSGGAVGAWAFRALSGANNQQWLQAITTDSSSYALTAQTPRTFEIYPYIQAGLTVNGSPNTISCWNNGTQYTSATASGTPVTPTGPTAIGAEYISHAISGTLSGRIYEIVVYNTNLNSTDMASVFGYLQAKWYPAPTRQQYLMTCFLGSDSTNEHFGLYTSSDGHTLTPVQTSLISPGGYCRNGDIILNTYDGYYYVCYQPTDSLSVGIGTWSTLNSNNFAVVRSMSAGAWNGPFGHWATVDCSSVVGNTSNSRCWGVRWFRDRNWNIYALVNLSTNGTTGPFGMYVVSPSTSDLSAWNTPVAVSSLNSLASDTIDGQVVDLRDGNYSWIYKYRPSGTGTGKAVQIANTPVTNGPLASLANVETGQSWGPYWANGDTYEAVCITLLSTGNPQAYADNYSSPTTGVGYSTNSGTVLTAGWSSVNTLSVTGLCAATMHVDLWPGFATLGTVTNSTATVSATDAQGALWSGGTYQWIQSENGGITWSNCTGTGTTTLSATISVPGGTTLIQLQYTDTLSNSVYSNVLTVNEPWILQPTQPVQRPEIRGALFSRIHG